jgi:hypothetical protein
MTILSIEIWGNALGHIFSFVLPPKKYLPQQDLVDPCKYGTYRKCGQFFSSSAFK